MQRAMIPRAVLVGRSPMLNSLHIVSSRKRSPKESRLPIPSFDRCSVRVIHRCLFACLHPEIRAPPLPCPNENREGARARSFHPKRGLPLEQGSLQLVLRCEGAAVAAAQGRRGPDSALLVVPRASRSRRPGSYHPC